MFGLGAADMKGALAVMLELLLARVPDRAIDLGCVFFGREELPFTESALGPLLRRLFPEIPRDHPAAGAIVLAIAANMLGLNNAATPLGIKAMEELQTLNPDKDTATNPMVTFLALTTSGVQIIPATMIGVLAAAGSQNPTVIIATSIIATAAGTLAAVVAAKLLQHFHPQTPAAATTEEKA